MAQVPESIMTAIASVGPTLPEPGRELRSAAKERFLARGLPTRRDEEWKYTSLRALEKPQFALRQTPTSADKSLLSNLVAVDDIAIVFIDGVLSVEHSRLTRLPPGLTVSPLSEALSAAVDSWDVIAKGADQDENPFADLNRALLGQGTVIAVTAKSVIEQTIHLVHVITTSETLTAPRHVLRAGKGSQAKVLETHIHLAEGPALTVCAVDVVVEENAILRHTRDQDGGAEGVQISILRAQVARDATYETFGLAQGGRLIRNDIGIELGGENSQVKLDGLYLVGGYSVIDNHTCIDHRVPRAISRQLYKGILDGEGRGVFNGKVVVRQDAQQTQAFQTNKNLVRSNKAEIDTKPELQIDADDVKCAHGATIGRLDANEIFYLQSRGIPREQAESILAAAFANDVIMRIDDEVVRGRIHRRAQAYFKPLKSSGKQAHE